MTRNSETVSLITPSHRGDLERCELLFESIDRNVTAFQRHYVIVNDEDVDLFKKFASERRIVQPVSEYLPNWLHRLPPLPWRRRNYWGSLRAKPVSGWHIQQLVKIQATATLPEDRFCLVDSDSVFFRPFDVSQIANPKPLPVHVYRKGAGDHRPNHKAWLISAHELLGLEPPTFPADDFIDTIIVWDKQMVRAMIARIEQLSGREWAETLCRIRKFSEYMIYGTFVSREAALRDRIDVTTDSFCRSYWDADQLSRADVLAMMENAAPNEVAICIQSFGPTLLSTIRESLDAFENRADPQPRRQLMTA